MNTSLKLTAVEYTGSTVGGGGEVGRSVGVLVGVNDGNNVGYTDAGRNVGVTEGMCVGEFVGTSVTPACAAAVSCAAAFSTGRSDMSKLNIVVECASCPFLPSLEPLSRLALPITAKMVSDSAARVSERAAAHKRTCYRTHRHKDSRKEQEGEWEWKRACEHRQTRFICSSIFGVPAFRNNCLALALSPGERDLVDQTLLFLGEKFV